MELDLILFHRSNIRDCCRDNKGFTLIEIIALLVLIAIMSAMAMSRVTATRDSALRVEIDTLKDHLRYAQNLAMNDTYPNKWGINLSGTTYTLVKFDGASTLSPYSLPNESGATHNFASGISASVTGNNPILFDEWGSPGTTTSSVSMGGESIIITANTGFIP
jgi:prepilin-type N-terminal cleavage/methylation domain-containing protein